MINTKKQAEDCSGQPEHGQLRALCDMLSNIQFTIGEINDRITTLDGRLHGVDPAEICAEISSEEPSGEADLAAFKSDEIARSLALMSGLLAKLEAL